MGQARLRANESNSAEGPRPSGKTTATCSTEPGSSLRLEQRFRARARSHQRYAARRRRTRAQKELVVMSASPTARRRSHTCRTCGPPRGSARLALRAHRACHRPVSPAASATQAPSSQALPHLGRRQASKGHEVHRRAGVPQQSAPCSSCHARVHGAVLCEVFSLASQRTQCVWPPRLT